MTTTASTAVARMACVRASLSRRACWACFSSRDFMRTPEVPRFDPGFIEALFTSPEGSCKDPSGCSHGMQETSGEEIGPARDGQDSNGEHSARLRGFWCGLILPHFG